MNEDVYFNVTNFRIHTLSAKNSIIHLTPDPIIIIIYPGSYNYYYYYYYGDTLYKLIHSAAGKNLTNFFLFQAHGVIFVIDSSDYSRFNEAKLVLEEIIGNNKIAGKPLLILANKQDNENALDEVDIIEYLNLEPLVNRQKCPTLVQSCSATEKSKLDPGIKKGYEWLLNNVVRNYHILNQRVEKESREQEIREREEMAEKIKRIREQQDIEKNRANQDVIETYSEYLQKIDNIDETSEQVINVLAFEDIIQPSKSSSSSSSVSFPPIYVTNNCALPERPKSAVQIVRHQLEMNNTVRKHSLPLKSNKTAPVNLYADKPPHSAQERRRTFSVANRTLKSADDTIIAMKHFHVTNGVSNMGPSGDYLPKKDIFQTNHITKLPPLNCQKKIVPWIEQNKNGDTISVIEIE